MKNLRHRLAAFGRIVVELAPVLAALTRASHPVAWVGAAAFIAYRLHDHFEDDRPCLWGHISRQQRKAILSLAVAAGAGCLRNTLNGVEYRILDGVTFGGADDWSYGPVGRGADVIPAWLWQHCAQSFLVSRDEADELSMTAEPSVHAPPSERVRQIADECVKMSSAGARIGLLIDGAPGTGKSEALLYVAARLGGKTLRADLKIVAPKDVVGIASVMKPDAVILDDVDRGPTEGALSAVDRLQAMGIAVLASSNDSGKICEALIRDGRIDDHHTFGAVEPDVLARLTADTGLPSELVADLATRTVSTVARYMERRTSLGHERALEMLRALPAKQTTSPNQTR